MVKVDVSDFYAVERASINIEGFTAVVGAMDSGKSFLLKSVMYALFNKPGNHTRHGGARSVVNLYFDGTDNFESLNYRWVKEGSQVSVEVNGTTYSKLGRGALDLSRYGIREVAVGDLKYNFNYWGQFSEPFLVFQSPGKIFDFLVKVFESDRFTRIHKKLSSDLRDKQRRLEDLSVLLHKMRERYDSLNEVLNRSCMIVNSLDSLDKVLKNKKSLLDKCVGLEKCLTVLTVIRRILEKVPEVKELITLLKSKAIVLSKISEMSNLLSQKLVLLVLKERLNQVLIRSKRLSLLYRLFSVVEKLNKLLNLISCLEKLKMSYSTTLVEIKSFLGERIQKYLLIDSFVSSQESLRKEREFLLSNILILEERKRFLESQLKFCPLCKREFV